jgi:hypothetical protein
MVRSFLAFRTRQQPYMVRRNYRHELRSALTFPLAGSLAEGSFTGVIAAKNFGAGVVLMSVISAAPMFGNIMAIVWSNVAIGRRKVPMVNTLQLGVVLMIASVALCQYLPREMQGWVFAGQIIIARLLVSGIITLRSTIWRANYPRSVRGQVTSRIAVVAATVLAATTFAGSYLLDRDSQAYIYLYPGAALLGLFGIYQFSRIRVRREVLLLRAEEQLYAPRPESMAQTDESNVINYPEPAARRSLLDLFRNAFRILKEDKAFREYQRYQMLSGFSFMMFTPSLLYMVSTEMTDPNRQYLLATVVVQIIPMVVVLASQQLWAPLFDRVHVTVFRVYQCTISVAAMLLLFAGAISGNGYQSLAIIAMAQVLVGASNAGGNLAWNLGHNDFAPAEKAGEYMGVHVMLTGLRGCIAPFLGSWLYLVPWIGRGIFGLSALVCLAALIGFVRMARHAPTKRGR